MERKREIARRGGRAAAGRFGRPGAGHLLAIVTFALLPLVGGCAVHVSDDGVSAGLAVTVDNGYVDAVVLEVYDGDTWVELGVFDPGTYEVLYLDWSWDGNEIRVVDAATGVVLDVDWVIDGLVLEIY
ncbi:MAG: hypothetical protein D6776_02295 [Planctomycetota bacterium]|nr:MAG: hypothetical protein D6776_02295 [Planctomycetota bacterium]